MSLPLLFTFPSQRSAPLSELLNALRHGFLLCSALGLMACGAQQREDAITSMLKSNQERLVQCEVDRSNAERDADLSRGQRELAEQSAEQAVASRVAVERENKELSQELNTLKELIKTAQERGQLHLGGATPSGTRGAASQEHVIRKLSASELLELTTRVSTEAKPLKGGVLAVFGKLKSRLYFNPKNLVLSSIAHFSGFSAGLSFVNTWNQKHRFGRLYLDDDGDITIESELDLEPGVRREALVAWVKGYGVLINLLHQQLVRWEQENKGEGKPRGKKKAKTKSL
jgi:hypothetical protein